MPDLAPDLAAGEIAGPDVGWLHTVIRVDVDVGTAGSHLPYQGAERPSRGPSRFALVKAPLQLIEVPSTVHESRTLRSTTIGPSSPLGARWMCPRIGFLCWMP
jgi:hypothetical protein